MNSAELPTGDLIGPADWAELFGLLSIPSVSVDPTRAPDVRRAAEWVRDYMRRHGGGAELVETGRAPLVVGRFRAAGENAADAPNVLLYAHFDVQPPGPEESWSTDPFEPTVRDGWIYARGASDDKASLFALLRATASLACEGALAVNVQIVCDGEEESEGETVVEWLRSERPVTDLAIVVDGLMRNHSRPVFVIGARGCVSYRVKVQTGDADVHSGLFGGVALNAVHALMMILGAVADVPDELRAGSPEIAERQLSAWASVEDGAQQLRLAGGRPISELALGEFHRRTFALPSVDVHGVQAGALDATIIPAQALASVSMRVPPGQDLQSACREFERLLVQACPPGASLSLERTSAIGGALTDPEHPIVKRVADAFEAVFGLPPLMLPMGATVPILEPLAALGIPTVNTGFTVHDANIHAPDERFPTRLLEPAVMALRGALLQLGSTSTPAVDAAYPVR